ncbi:MAG: hypothetical protein DRJ42_05100 [Deltaproteobacteria bacterium]|nr:MAG: hypothetical protein DRJ42_05100 [Deltaproteobacteria bacterium]
MVRNQFHRLASGAVLSAVLWALIATSSAVAQEVQDVDSGTEAGDDESLPPEVEPSPSSAAPAADPVAVSPAASATGDEGTTPTSPGGTSGADGPTPPGEAIETTSENTPEAVPEAPAFVPHREHTEPGDDAHPMDNHPVTGNIHFAPGGGLRIQSDDGHFGVRLSARVQPRWTVVNLPGISPEHEITLRRARVKFQGNLFGPDVRFKLELAFSPADLGVRDNLDPDTRTPTRSPLLSYFVEFRHLREAEVRVGQFKVASNRQRVISSANLQLVDRSILNSEFTLDRDVGIQVGSRDIGGLDLFTYSVGIYSGRGRDARGFGDFNLMYLGHFEVTPFGSFEAYAEGDFERTGPRLAVGTSYAFMDRGARDRGPIGSPPADGGTTTSHHYFADLMFKWAGLSVLSEFAWRDGSRAPGGNLDDSGLPIPAVPPRDGWGLNAQGGYILPWFPLGIEGRYAIVHGLEDSSLGDRQEVTGGLSYYFMEHAYKIQADYSRLWRTDSMTDGSDRVRVQLELSL